jgi:hypothetical protein
VFRRSEPGACAAGIRRDVGVRKLDRLRRQTLEDRWLFIRRIRPDGLTFRQRAWQVDVNFDVLFDVRGLSRRRADRDDAHRQDRDRRSGPFGLGR